MIAFLVAILAPLSNCFQQVPQLIKTYERKSVGDLSLGSLVLIFTSSLLWFTHGWFIGDMALVVSGLISIGINFLMLVMYWVYSNPTNRVAKT